MPKKTTRRRFLTATGVGATTAALSGIAQGSQSQTTQQGSSAWSQAGKIISRVKPPKFPNQDFVITEYGAVGDGETDCTDAFEEAIAKCTEAGGGRVVVPAGTFLTGPIHLEDDVNLHVTDDATIKFSRDPSDYLPQVRTRWEGIDLMNYSPLIYAYEKENIGVTGTGTIDGRGSNDYWWPWKGQEEHGWEEGDPDQEEARDRLIEMGEEGVPVEERVFGEGDYLRPMLLQPYRCENILVEGVTITDSPMWHIHPVLSENITIQDVTVENPTGPNADGCNPESCNDVLIQRCYFNTGDDCVAFKAGKNADGRRIDVPSENAVVQNCEMRDGHGGVTMGSEMTGGVRNIFARNCQMDSPNLDRVLRIKTNSKRGGYVRNIHMKNIEVSQSGEAIRINFHYGGGQSAGSHNPSVSDIHVKNVDVGETEYALDLRGYEDSPIQNVQLKNCVFEEVERDNRIENVEGLSLDNVVIGDERYKE